MGFNRAQVSPDGRLPQPMYAGVGLLSNFLVTAFAAETDEILTIGEVSGGSIVQGTTLTSDVVYTLPTAALLLAAGTPFDTMDIGDAYTFLVTNSQAGAFDVVIAIGAGITAVGANNTLSVPPQASRIFTLVKTAAATFDLY